MKRKRKRKRKGKRKRERMKMKTKTNTKTKTKTKTIASSDAPDRENLASLAASTSPPEPEVPEGNPPEQPPKKRGRPRKVVAPPPFPDALLRAVIAAPYT